LSAWLTGIFVIGFAHYCTREYIRSSVKSPGNSIIFKLFIFQLVGAALAFGLNLIAIFFISPKEFFLVYLICSIGTLGAALNLDWVIYSKGNISFIFWRLLIIRTTIIFLIVVLIHSSHDLMIFVLISTAGNIASNLVSFIWIIKKEKIIWKLPIAEDFYNARHFFASNLIGSMQQYFDQVIAGVFLPMADVAYLAICRQLISFANGIMIGIGKLMMSYSVHETLKNSNFNVYIKKIAKPYLAMSICVGLGICALGRLVTQWLTGNNFIFEWWVFWVCGACFFATSVAVFIDMQISIPLGREKLTTYANVIVTVFLGLGLFYISLHPIIGYGGILIALFIAESLGALFMILNYQKGFR